MDDSKAPKANDKASGAPSLARSGLQASGSAMASSRAEVMARAAWAKFQVPKKVKVKTPFQPPPEKDLFQYTGRTARQLHQDLVKSGTEAQLACRVRRGEVGGRPRQERVEEQLGPPRRRRSKVTPTQPHTADDYLLAVRTTARDKNLARVAKVESERLQKELESEKAINTELESQLQHHEAALQEFLQHHYRQVTEALTKGETARRNLTEQEIRIDYFSGLLAEARTVQEEEEERLQELTAFQQFLAAVTPSHSLKDLKRRLQEVQDEVKITHGEADEGNDPASSNSLDIALAASVAASSTSGNVSPSGEGGGGGALGADLMSLRMMRPGKPSCQSPTRAGDRLSQTPEDTTELATIPQDGPDTCDAAAFDEFLGDDGHLVDLACVYESQCHALLALLTRLRAQTEAINKEGDTRQKRLDSRLQEIQQLQEKAKGGGHEDQLRDLRTLIGEWARLSGDAEAQCQLDQLVAQIAEVVSDVFGSSEYSPLVPPTQTATVSKQQVPKTTTRPKSKDGKGSPSEEPMLDPVSDGASVSHGMGQEALLALLEARVTDLCAQLDNIDPALRDAIFLNCEQTRRARLKEEKRLETEMKRAERKQRHLERALAEPPPKPL
ncbi:coiled-coil domain-containing protein 38 [Procambarus clarkii]|uniref:coiled-coil domain-containing protein 38 n=1 Tax=Procambarus clarkii TaxID=6728 RepID=UPI0037434B6B